MSERVIDFRAQKSMPPDDIVLTEHACAVVKITTWTDRFNSWLTNRQTLLELYACTDQSKEEEFASIIEVSEAVYTNTVLTAITVHWF